MRQLKTQKVTMLPSGCHLSCLHSKLLMESKSQSYDIVMPESIDAITKSYCQALICSDTYALRVPHKKSQENYTFIALWEEEKLKGNGMGFHPGHNGTKASHRNRAMGTNIRSRRHILSACSVPLIFLVIFHLWPSWISSASSLIYIIFQPPPLPPLLTFT